MTVMDIDANEAARKEIDKIVDAIRPLLSGQKPEVIGSALSEVTAMFVAGCEPKAREAVIGLFLLSVEKFVPVFDKMLYGEQGFPKEFN